MSAPAATIDLRLAPYRRLLVPHGRSHTKRRSVLNKESHVTDALDFARGLFPFPIEGIDSDNGSEFINAHFFDYCVANKLTFTVRVRTTRTTARTREKNWTHVRELVGYLRFDTTEELELLNAIWSLDGRFTNHLLTQHKLIERRREGSKLIKRYDVARMPVERTIASGAVSKQKAASLRKMTRAIGPGDLSRRITALVAEHEELAVTKRPTPIRRVNRAFNSSDRPEVRGEHRPRRSRAI